jgi:hypothetical protein
MFSWLLSPRAVSGRSHSYRSTECSNSSEILAASLTVWLRCFARESGVQVAVQDKIPVQPQGCTQGLWFHERGTILVAADPGAEL